MLNTLSDLRQFTNSHLNLSEFKELCFELDFDFENLFGEIKNEKIIDIIKRMHKEQRLLELVDWLANHYSNTPGIDWTEAKEVYGALQQYNIANAEFEGESRLPAPFQAPPPLPYFIDRNEYLTLLETIEDEPSATVRATGLIGTGKSAIANQAANHLRDKFPDGVIWLRGDQADIETDLQQTAVAYGQIESFNQQPTLEGKIDFIRQLLAPKQALVVFDNVSDEKDVSRLLNENHRHFTLVTTRDNALLKNFAKQEIIVSTFDEKETIAYLIQILGDGRVAFESEAVEQLHHLLGGLPLALGVVGGMLRESAEITIDEYNQMLLDESTRIEGLTDWISGANNIAASFELSYQTMPNHLQSFFNSLSVFSGMSFSSQAVATINQVILPKVKLGLGSMVRLSLIQFDEKKGRYSINPLVHSFAVQKCGTNLAQFQEQGITYYLDLLTKRENPNYEQMLQDEWQNLLGVFKLLAEQHKWQLFGESIYKLTQFERGTMGFLEKHGYWQEARVMLTQCLAAEHEWSDTKLLASLHLNASSFALLQNEIETATQQLELVRPLLPFLMNDETCLWQLVQWHELSAKLLFQEDRSQLFNEMISCLNMLQEKSTEVAQVQLGYVYSRLVGIYGRQGDLENAEAAALKSQELLPDEPSPVLIGLYSNFNLIYLRQGKLAAGKEAAEKALAHAEASNTINQLPMLWNIVGQNQQNAGEFAEAVTNYTRSRSLAERIGDTYRACGSILNLGQVYLMLGNELLATKYFTEALSITQREAFRDVESLTFSNLIDLYLITGDLTQAHHALEQSLEIATQLEMGYLMPTLIRQQAQLTRLGGAQDEALTLIEEAIEMAAKSKDRLEEGVAYRVKGEILVNDNRIKEGNMAYQESERILRDYNDYEWARTLLSLASYFIQQPDFAKRMIPALKKAGQVFARVKAQRELEHTKIVLQEYITKP